MNIVAFLVASALAQTPQFSAGVREFIVTDSPVVVIRNVRVIDGTGAAPRENQTIVIRGGKIASIEPSAVGRGLSAGYVVDGNGKTVIPGLVLVHEHMFYPGSGGGFYPEQPYVFPRLYLAAGITTARTGGSMSPYTDLNIRRNIDAGRILGPKLDVTGPYLNGENNFPQMYALKDAADARRFVNFWADAGATSFKAYMSITRDQLRAAVDEAHKRGIKVTGHLCSVTYREAAEIGIDNLEHNFFASTDPIPGKRPDSCPSSAVNVFANMDPATDTVMKSVIRTLVDRRVALTSTLSVMEAGMPERSAPSQRLLETMSTEARARFLQRWAAASTNPNPARLRAWRNILALTKMFADAGGQLVVGTDPTGNGGTIPGISSQHELELLVDAGFTPLEAIKAATLNGATYLGRADRVGSIAVGKDADLVLIVGNPAAQIGDVQKVELVFKDGVAYDSAKLFASVRGLVGQ
jgi:imidazolonepropionase-like amidohydrolase